MYVINEFEKWRNVIEMFFEGLRTNKTITDIIYVSCIGSMHCAKKILLFGKKLDILQVRIFISIMVFVKCAS